MLRDLFSTAKSIKFLIIMKHPLTINVATPRHAGWRYYRDTAATLTAAQDHQLSPESIKKIPITLKQQIENGEFFLDFLSRNVTSETKSCSLGWIEAHKLLYSQLKRDFNQSLESVRIVRYEKFADPIPLCIKIFQFIFNNESQSFMPSSDLSRAVKEVSINHEPLPLLGLQLFFYERLFSLLDL